MDLNYTLDEINFHKHGKTKNIEIFDNNLCLNLNTYKWEKFDYCLDSNIDLSPILFIPSNLLTDNYWHFVVENLFMIAYIYNKFNLPESTRLLIDTSLQPSVLWTDYTIYNNDISNVVGIKLLEYFINDKKNIICFNSSNKSGIVENIYTNKLIKGTGGLNEPVWNFNTNKYIDTWFYLRNKIMNNLHIKECRIQTFNILFVNRESASNKRIINNSEVINNINKLLNRTKYTLINKDFAKISVKEQIELVNKVDIVICSRGAGMVNAMFLKKNATFLFCTPYGKSKDNHPDTVYLVPFIPNYYNVIDCKCILNWGNWKDNEYNTNNLILCLSNIIKSINN